MKQVSTKQAKRNAELAKIKAKLQKSCVLCGRPANDLCHLLPKSIWPEWHTEPQNLIIMCREYHCAHDDRMSFRTLQNGLYEQVLKFDEKGAKRYYGIE
jgi:5-methylcytosine-specific restriction endonuclease McrA